MEESNQALEAEKAKLEEEIRRLEASNQDLTLGLRYTLEALEHQREKPFGGKAMRYEGDRDSMISKIHENNLKLDVCKVRLKEIERYLAVHP